VTVPFKSKLSNSWIREASYTIFFLLGAVAPLVCDPISQLGFFAVVSRNIAVPVDFAIVGKLAQTVFQAAP
jgi:hypothetical protein